MLGVSYKTQRLSDGTGGNHIFPFHPEMASLPRYGSVNISERDAAGGGGRQASNNDSRPDVTESGEDLADTMRRRLRFFFMNPLEKWETKRQFPYKLAIQLIKIFFVTVQVSFPFATLILLS